MVFEKQELKYIGLSLLVITILMLLINIDFLNKWISSLHPIMQFTILNIGLYIAFFILLKGIAKGKRLIKVFEGALANILFFLSFDTVLPEYHTTTKGLITGGIFSESSADYIWGWIYQNIFGVSNGWLLVILTYGFTFLLLFGLGSYLYEDFLEG